MSSRNDTTETPNSPLNGGREAFDARTDRLIQLLQYSSDGVCEFDVEGRCTYCNATGAHLLGFETSELEGRVLHDLIHPGGQFLDLKECAICQAVNNAQGFKIGEPMKHTHGVLSHKSGRAVPVGYRMFQIVENGELKGAVMTFYDDAERRRLAQELHERTRELEESEHRKTEFVATLAHELRNPLAPLRAALNAMRKASTNATSMEQLRGVMERQLEQLIHLVNDLLDIARDSSGQMTLSKERITLQEILAGAAEATLPLRDSNQNSLDLDIPVEPLYLEADRTRLTQVFTNLLNNAAQFSAPGGPITVHVDILGDEVRIDIADSGVGIAREALNRIFDMFTRVGRGSIAASPGLGIGLNLARRLVELHGGKLTASSDGLGKGSHFLTTLPLPDKEPATLLDESEPAAAAGRAIRVLIVDDNVDAAVTLNLLLQLGGHTTLLAHNGAAALEMLREFKPDVVLLDLGLPDMDGYEVARAIRRSPVRQPLLVAVTGWGSAEDRLRTKQAGFDQHLTKPVDISTIELIFTTLPPPEPPEERNDPSVSNGHTLDTPQ